VDDTKPVLYDGDTSVPGVIRSKHYPEGYEKNPSGDPYSAWSNQLDSSRPSHFGEILAVRPGTNDNGWWIGVWPRGLRALEFAHICPRVYYSDTRITAAQEKLQALAYHPIALFDKAYDQLGVVPFKDNNLPSLSGGTTITRQLYLFNDDYRDRSVSVTISAVVDGQTLATGGATYDLALGAHQIIPCTLQVPKRGGKVLSLIRRTSKNGQQRFEETARFHITGETSGSTSSSITLAGGGSSGGGSNTKPTVALTSPHANETFTLPASIRIIASASDSDGSISKVEFYANGSLITTENSAPYDWTWSNVAAGTYVITAKAYDNNGTSTLSTGRTIRVESLFSARVNFQPSSAPTPSNWLIDSGEIYAARLGKTYGWNVDVSSTSRDRNDSASADQAHDTLIHMQKVGTENARWEMAVPNGTYEVRIVAGDPAYWDSVFRIAVEGVVILTGNPSSNNRWLEATATIVVTDGKLTVSNGSNADNNKINVIEITSVPATNG
jgi:hypothetical protein